MKKNLIVFLSLFAASQTFSFDARAYFDSLSPVDQVSQLFLVNVEGNVSYSAVESYEGKPVVPGGCLLFSFNIGDTPEQVKGYIESMGTYCSKNSLPVPYVAVDQEGGTVNRLRGITSPLMASKNVAEKFSAGEAYSYYSRQAEEMKALGISMNLAPVSEAAVSSNKVFLGTRSFGSPAKTCTYSVSCAKAYEDCGIGAVLKHFPGNTNTDPHTGLPEIGLSERDVEKYLLRPFCFALLSNPSAVLMSHARVRDFCGAGDVPACFSRFWIEDVLRKKMGFRGLVISDDIFMGALADNGYPPEEAAFKAIGAGVDIIMLSEKKFLKVALSVLERSVKDPEFAERIRQSGVRVIEFKHAKGVL